jgi:aspartate ammonia-lyase
MDGKNTGGRPRAPEPRTAVSTWLPHSTADRVIRRAAQEGKSVSEVVREVVTEEFASGEP